MVHCPSSIGGQGAILKQPTMENNIEITGCGDCPMLKTLHRRGDVFFRCAVLALQIYADSIEELFENCDLRKGAITITLKTNNNGKEKV